MLHLFIQTQRPNTSYLPHLPTPQGLWSSRSPALCQSQTPVDQPAPLKAAAAPAVFVLPLCHAVLARAAGAPCVQAAEQWDGLPFLGHTGVPAPGRAQPAAEQLEPCHLSLRFHQRWQLLVCLGLSLGALQPPPAWGVSLVWWWWWQRAPGPQAELTVAVTV